MDSKQPVEVSVALYSVDNSRHTCAGTPRLEVTPEQDFCGFCGALLDKKAEIRVHICMPNTGVLKPFLVGLSTKIRHLAEKEIASYLDAAAALSKENT